MLDIRHIDEVKRKARPDYETMPPLALADSIMIASTFLNSRGLSAESYTIHRMDLHPGVADRQIAPFGDIRFVNLVTANHVRIVIDAESGKILAGDFSLSTAQLMEEDKDKTRIESVFITGFLAALIITYMTSLTIAHLLTAPTMPFATQAEILIAMVLMHPICIYKCYQCLLSKGSWSVKQSAFVGACCGVIDAIATFALLHLWIENVAAVQLHVLVAVLGAIVAFSFTPVVLTRVVCARMHRD